MANDSSSPVHLFAAPLSQLYFAIGAVGFLLNVFVILVVTRREIIASKIARVLVVNQCFGNALAALFSATGSMVSAGLRVPESVVGDLICHLWVTNYLQWSCVHASINMVMLFTVERYLSIMRPRAHQRLSIRFIYGLIALCWIKGAGMAIAVAFTGERQGNVCGRGYIPSTPLRVQGGVVLFLYFSPLFVLGILYSHMICFLKRQARLLVGARRNAGLDGVSRDLTITAGVTGTSYCILYTTAASTNFMFTQGIMNFEFQGLVILLSTSLANINFFIVNPLVFVVFLRAFRRELRRMCSRRAKYEENAQALAVGTSSSSGVKPTTAVAATSTTQVDA